MSNDECETVLIKGDAGPTRINKFDYDKEKHGKILGGKEAEKEDDKNKVVALKVEKKIEPVNDLYLAKNGKKDDEARFIVVDKDGVPVVAAGTIDPEGYKTEQEAFAAMVMVTKPNQNPPA